ncbi:ROK family transcriptional regulator [Sphaerisporangium sp. NBC_01403]|uniref:ROK family transcriptional regulator n=1 Tax=Sphaerisporangium sp. NBC_01403 TaxID=2903599 RepID=UPI0032430CF1
MPGDATLLSVLRHLIDHGPLSRPDLGEGVELARATTSSLVNDLLRRGLVAEIATPSEGRRGRPTTLLDLDDTRYAVAGLEIAMDRIHVAVYSLRGRELLRIERTGEAEAVNPRALLRRAAMVLQEALDVVEDDRRTLLGVGVSVPGLVDASTGTVKYVPSLGWRDVALKEGVTEALGGRAPVMVDSDANFAALAERRSRMRGGADASSLVYLTGTYGISAGIIAGGRLWRGARGMAGEVGHLILDSPGLRCVCGRNGCFETRAGLQPIVESALETHRRPGRGHLAPASAVDEVVGLAHGGDETVIGSLAAAGRWIGLGAAMVSALLDPQVVVLGGHYARIAPWILGPARESFAAALLVSGPDTPRLEVSTRSAWTATEGAALAVLMSLAEGDRTLPE